jgi:hypothetical protein
MELAEKIKAWLNQEHTSRSSKFLQMAVLIIGGIFAMVLGAVLVGVILIASPLLTVLILLFLLGYGIAAAARGKAH